MHRQIVIIGLAIIVALMVAVAWASWGNRQPRTPAPLTMSRKESFASDGAVSVLRDFYELKYPSERRAGFCVCASNPAAIFVLATGVQILADSGWQQYSEEPRNEIWRLQPGTAKEMYVEIPEKQSEQIWRAYIRYAPEMRGPPLLMVQLREAWKIRSFTNWAGKAWGGGRFGGQSEFVSREFSKE